MHYRGPGAGGPMPEFDPSRMVDGFPGDVAVAAGRWEGAVPLVSVMATNGEPWALELFYPVGSRPGLAVRTIRSARALDARHMPVEDLASVMTNFVLNHGDEPRPDLSGGAESRASAAFALSRGIRARVSDFEPARTTISIDGDEYIARRIDLLGCTAVEVPWADQTVFCVAGTEDIHGLGLRTLRPGETAQW
jgi:hypothetical protein